MRRTLIATALLATTGCATSGAPTSLMRAPDYTPREIRQPALFVHVEESALGEGEREALAARYEGALVEAFDERGVPPTDVQSVTARSGLEPRHALARAREVQADYALIVELRLEHRDAVFCRNSRRPFAATTTVWSQGLRVLRVRDGISRLAVPPGQGLDVTEIEPDCANPRRSRLRDRAEMIASAVEVVAERIFGR